MIPLLLSAVLAPTSSSSPQTPVWIDAKPVSLIYTYKKAFTLPPGTTELSNELQATIPTYSSPAVPIRIHFYGAARGSKLKLPLLPAIYLTLDDVPDPTIGTVLMKVDKADFSTRTPNPGIAAHFHLTRDSGPNILAIGTIEADIVRKLEKVELKWKEVHGHYEADLFIKGPGDFTVSCDCMAKLAGRKIAVPYHLTAKWNEKLLYDATKADQRIAAHVVEGSKWWEDYTIHLELSIPGPLKPVRPGLTVLYFEHPRPAIWELQIMNP